MQVIPLRHPWTWAASVLVVLVAAGVAWSVTTNLAFRWPVVAQYLFDGQILAGLLRTLELTVAAMSLGLVLGTALAIMRLSDNKLLYVLSWLYIWFFRSVPVLVQLIFWYNFGALYAHVTLALPWGPVLYSASTNDVITPLTAALAGLGLAQAAYTAEVIRAGILSVSPGQTRAAKALGMRPATIFIRIVFPQAMRVIIPPVGNELISMVKGTSLVSVIAMADLLYTAQLYLCPHLRDDPAADRGLPLVPRHRLGAHRGAARVGTALRAWRVSEPMVRIRGLRKSFGAKEVLCGIDMDVAPGSVMCIIGPSGSGKSTLLSCINHLERIDGGRMWVGGELVGYREHAGKLYELPERKVAGMRARIGMVFQHFNLFPHMTAVQNIIEAPVQVNRQIRRPRRAARPLSAAGDASAWPTGAEPFRLSFPVASSSGSPSRGRWRWNRS